MKRFTGSVCIDQGTRVLFDEVGGGSPMLQGSGPRGVRAFQAPLIDAPAVMVSLAMRDIDHRTNSRMDVSAAAIAASGFEIVFRTWGDSRIARVRADWIAIGPTRGDEDWNVT